MQSANRTGAGRRFTVDGSPALEARLLEICAEVRAGVEAIVPPTRLEGLLLGGGYGRGEGGVLRGAEDDAPYNDLEFYVFVRGVRLLAERAFHRQLHELGERLGPAAGVEIEFKLITARSLRGSPTTMFYYDLVCGHREVHGAVEPLLAKCEHHRDASRIPLSEAARLLMNRCSGLLFAAELLERPMFERADSDFVRRNLAKAQLAFGDVILTAEGQYHWSCLERRRRFAQLPLGKELAWAAALKEHHSVGVEFKLHPFRSDEPREPLAAAHRELTALARQLWLWLESRRLGRVFSSIQEYAMTPLNKCPETRAAKNSLINLRIFGRNALSGSAFHYPRERLFNSLALLLFEPEFAGSDQGLQSVQQELDTQAATFPEMIAAYKRLWQRFN